MKNMASIELFTSPTCPHCPSAKELVRKVSKELKINAKEYSTATKEGSRKANSYGIMSVPTIIIKGSKEIIGLRGTPSREKLIESLDIADGLKEAPQHTTLWEDIVNLFKKLFLSNKKEDEEETDKDKDKTNEEESNQE
jgi:small redox-active disulfide protein 1